MIDTMALTRSIGVPVAASPSTVSTPSLVGSDFIRLTSPRRQALITVMAETGNGKSHLPLFYAPEPVYFVNLDGRADDVVRDALASGRDIHYTEVANPSSLLHLSVDECKRVCKEGVTKILRNMELARKQSLVGTRPGTIVLDTGTELSDLVTLAIRGSFDKVSDYGESKATITRQMMRFFAIAREGKCHLIVLARPAQVWKDNKPVQGKNKVRGHDFLSEGVDWVGELRMKARKPTDDNPNPFTHELEITKPGVNAQMIGKVFKASDWEMFGGPFVYANWQMYRGSQPGDWT